MLRKPNNKGHKNSFQWIGPRRIASVISPVVYGVSTLDRSKTQRVNASRIRLYHSFLSDAKPAKHLL